MRKVNILILEDEQRAGEKLLDLIEEICLVNTIEWKRSIKDATEYLKTAPQLDIIFSDIELLDGNVFKVYETIQPKCPIIFCTAYNAFYEEAFRTNGISYLLKPYTSVAFINAWNKFILLFDAHHKTIPPTIISELKYLIEKNKRQFKTTFSVKKRDGVYLLSTDDVFYFQAQGDFVLAIDKNDRKHIINDSLTGIENQVNSTIFFRINRSEIIHRNSILKYNQHIKNRLAITLTDSKTILFSSNSRTPEFRTWIENPIR